MGEVVSVKVTDNSKLVLKLLADQVEVALEAVGIKAEGYAKMELEKYPRRVDTGLLRNSITHAVSGKPAAISSYQSNDNHADTAATRRAGTAGKPVDPPKEGKYEGTAPQDPDTKKAVYIGTNVEYAVYVHNGTMRMKEKNPFLKNAVTKHKDEYKAIFKQHLGT